MSVIQWKLAGGFLLRFGMVRTAPVLLQHFSNLDPETLNYPLWQVTEGKVLIGLTVILALAIPVIVRQEWSLSAGATSLAGFASLLVTASVVYYCGQAPGKETDPFPRLLVSPEDGRVRGGGPGASSGPLQGVVQIRSKIHGSAAHDDK